MIQALRFMSVINRFGGFQFDRNGAFDDPVSNIDSDDHAVVIDIDRSLLVHLQSVLSHFMCQRVLVDFLQKPNAKLIRTLNAAPIILSVIWLMRSNLSS